MYQMNDSVIQRNVCHFASIEFVNTSMLRNFSSIHKSHQINTYNILQNVCTVDTQNMVYLRKLQLKQQKNNYQ
jgi:hypothetical protein